MKNKVSVMISLYRNDDAHYYREAIQSIIDQSYGIENINIYQVIDGSISEELETVIEHFSSYFYKVIRLETNNGLANALNKLIQIMGDEEYIFRMDSDDISKPDRFDNQISFMERNKSIGICGMAISEFYEDGSLILRSYPLKHDLLISNLSKASPFAHPTVCFRATALKLLGSYSTKYHLCEDIHMWFRAVILGVKFANLPDVGLDFRIQRNFFKRRSLSKAWAEFKVYLFGGFRLFGYGFWILFPLLRLVSRLMPPFLIKYMYKYSLRTRFLN
ncbi:MAG: cellulose synthase/poly-beta-1,6-N-acetylglucosamine synthase-like glycosyltransferase [Colwellia sp.]|jgi:cellulose synthase/poly-beta-1,6-N-acetylglucosamine synthase-like glycosyltransferase